MATVTVSTSSSVDGRDNVLVENGGTYTTQFDLDSDPNPNGNEGNFVSVYMYATLDENGDISDALGGFNAEYNQYDTFLFNFDPSLSLGIPIDRAENGVAVYDIDVSPEADFSILEIRLTEQNNTLTFTGIFDGQDDGPRTVYWNVIDNPNDFFSNTVVNGSNALIEVDDASEIPEEEPDLPVVSVSIDAGTVAIEDDAAASTITINFSVDGDIPAGGLPVAFSLFNENVNTGLGNMRAFGDFDVPALLSGAGFDNAQLVRVWSGNDGATVRLTDTSASITLQVLNDSDAQPGQPGFDTDTDLGPETTTVTVVSVDDQGTAFDQYTVSETAPTASAGIDDSTFSQTVTNDIEGTRDWATRTAYFDTNGDLARIYDALDDGGGAYVLFEAGARTRKVSYDLAENKPWIVTNTAFKNGDLAERWFGFDDGRERLTTFEDNVRSQATERDLADVFVFDTKVVTFDENGDRAARVIDFDDGRQSVLTFVDNTRRESTTTDHEDAFDWNTTVIAFDENGVRAETTRVFDDGREHIRTLDAEGRVVSKTGTDPNDVRNWASFVDTYVDGVRTQRELTMDTGAIVVIDFTLDSV